MQHQKFSIKKTAKDLACDFAGTSMQAIGILAFSAPNHVAPGGASGIATLVNYLFGLPIGVVTLLINAPLLLVGYKVLGRRFSLSTLRTVVMSMLVTDLIWSHLPAYKGDVLLAALFAGVFAGIGSGIVFMNGSTTGGTDIVSKLILRKFPYIPTGTIVMYVNALVMIGAAVVYRNIEAVLYGLIMSFTQGKIMDGLIYGSDVGKYAMIITQYPEKLSRRIIKDLHRGVTILDGRGAYNGMETGVLVCVVRKQQFFELKKLIYQIDPSAFVIFSEANEIIGNGFKSIEGITSA